MNFFKKNLSFSKEISSFSEGLIKKAKGKGRAIGIGGAAPSKNSNIFQLAFVTYILGGCEQLFNKLFSFVETKLQDSYTRYQQILKDYSENNVFEKLLAEKKILLKALKKRLKEVGSFFKVQRADDKEEIINLKNKIKNWEQELNELSYTKTFWPVLVSIILIIGILASEAFVNQKAFLFIKGESYFSSLTIALGISFCTFLLGLGASKIIQNEKLEMIEKIMYVGLIFLVSLGVYYSVAEQRVSMMENLSTGSGRSALVISKTTLVMINLGFFLSLILVKIYLFPSPEIFKKNAKYKQLKKSIKKALNKISKLQLKIKNSHDKERSEKSNVRQEFEAKMKALDVKIREMKETLKAQQIIYNRTLSIGFNLREELLNLASKAIGVFVAEMNSFRNDKVILEMPTKELLFSKNPLKDYEFIDDKEIDTFIEATEISLFTGKKNNKNNKNDTDDTDDENNKMDEFEIDL